MKFGCREGGRAADSLEPLPPAEAAGDLKSLEGPKTRAWRVEGATPSGTRKRAYRAKFGLLRGFLAVLGG